MTSLKRNSLFLPDPFVILWRLFYSFTLLFSKACTVREKLTLLPSFKKWNNWNAFYGICPVYRLLTWVTSGLDLEYSSTLDQRFSKSFSVYHVIIINMTSHLKTINAEGVPWLGITVQDYKIRFRTSVQTVSKFLSLPPPFHFTVRHYISTCNPPLPFCFKIKTHDIMSSCPTIFSVSVSCRGDVLCHVPKLAPSQTFMYTQHNEAYGHQ